MQATVTIQNFYQYRHVDKPGWKLGWTWANNEVIWSMSGAFATQQGNCSSFKFQIPHCCKRNPEIIDLMPDALPENRSENCCRGGLLYAYSINPSKSISSFEITVGNLENNSSGNPPLNLTLMAPGYGYTCGPVLDVDPSVSPVIGGRREEQALSKYFKSMYIYTKVTRISVFLTSVKNPPPKNEKVTRNSSKLLVDNSRLHIIKSSILRS